MNVFRGHVVRAVALMAALEAGCGGTSAYDRARTDPGENAGGSAGVAAATAGAANAGESATGGSGGNTTCAPASLGNWMPKWTPPNTPTPGVCSAGQLDTIERVCVSSATYDQAACNAFKLDEQNAACLSCVFTPVSDSHYGAVRVSPDRFWQMNVSGCVAELEGDVSSSGCGAKLQAYEACLAAACEPACFIGKTAAEFSSCETAATAGDCRSYLLDAACADAPKYDECNAYSNFTEYFTGMANFFCGAGFEPPAAADSGGSADN